MYGNYQMLDCFSVLNVPTLIPINTNCNIYECDLNMCAIKSASTYPDCQMIPEMQWKIDPMYSSCCNLFIKDILELPLYTGSQENTFMYKNHPIRLVSLMGIVVKVEEKSQFFIYGVSVTSAQSLVDRMERWHLEQLTCLQVGDLIHLRGRLRMYRNAMQISVFSYGKVIDPTHSFEVTHMDSQITKYQRVYDVPFCTNSHLDKAMESRKRPKKSFKEHIHKSKNKNLAPQIVAVLKEAIKNLLHKGLIFKSKRMKGLHYLTLANKQLKKEVCHILKKDCQKKHYLNGCHFLHIYDTVINCDDFQCLTHVALKFAFKLFRARRSDSQFQ
ncbi:CST complex subunit STN1 [Holothuria leucospilota]|uniref:CST complex subunit STN1 n=1 Tax=Holothuria leucospilota TaxID=206669 RepID=A0A9Q1HC44_HOLLE|nr:CST complex subunit STN1 [Holothuria leucospilota]